MFRKAQLKLFAIITCILLAVFIAVLGSINIIMQAVMQRQSKEVLKKIAVGVEYDEKTSTFTFKPSDNFDPGRNDWRDIPRTESPSKPTETTAAATTAAVTTTTAVPTEQVVTTQYQQQTQAVVTYATSAQTVPATTVTTAVTTFRRDTRTEAKTVTTHPRSEPATQPAHTEPATENNTQGQWWGGGQGGDGQWPQWPPPWWGNGGGQWGGFNPVYPPYGGWGYYGPGSEFQQETENVTGDNQWNMSLSPEEDYEIVPLGRNTLTLDDLFADLGMGDGRESMERRQETTEPVPKSLGSIDFFIVMADTEGKYLATLNNDDLEADTAQKYVSAILKEKSSSGMIDNKYQFYQMGKSNGTIMVFTDKSAEIDMLKKLNRTTIAIGILSFMLLAAAAFFLSKKVMQPLKSAFEKQKQFISDASHELKTPLTVISANADVLTDEIGENRWLTYIKSQTDRMNILVNDLLNLTRLENNSTNFVRTDFDLSKAINNTALPFECQAFELNKKYYVDVEEGLMINGSEQHIKQMVAIFIDNALKYSGENGTIKVSLKHQGDKKIFSVYNTGKGIRDEEADKIFERFYRSDASRNRATGGYGLGLAIAKSIIDKHKFKINVENVEGRSIRFVVIM